MGVIDRTYTADEIKLRFTARAYFDGHIIASESEYLRKPDLFTITRDLKANEYEIKVSLSDLRKELRYIETVMEDQANGVVFEDDQLPFRFTDEVRQLNSVRKVRTDDNKYRKHRLYLYGESDRFARSSGRPNRFYFLIPRFLYEAEKTRLDAIPYYGVVDAFDFSSLKRCRPLHSGTIDAETVWQAAHNIQGRALRPVETSS